MLQGRTYKIESKINSCARKEAVLDVLTDYPNHSEVFSSIQSSQVVARSHNEAEVLQVSTLPNLKSDRVSIIISKYIKAACCRRGGGMCFGYQAAFRR